MKRLVIYEHMELEPLAQALSNKNRLRILGLLKTGSYNINDISKQLNMPMPTVTVNIKKLEESGLIKCTLQSGKHGKQKICSLKYSEIVLKLDDEEVDDSEEELSHGNESNRVEIKAIHEELLDIQLGNFTDFKIEPECGIATADNILEGNVSAFYSDDRDKASIIWFNDGYLKYPVTLQQNYNAIQSIAISFEACSQHMYFNKNWPTDITLWVNDCEIGTYTSEGYFGDRGELTPDWWPQDRPQHGEHICFKVDNNGSYVNNNKISQIKTTDIIREDKSLEIKIGVKKDAVNSRGVIIFGVNSGNFKQNINVNIITG